MRRAPAAAALAVALLTLSACSGGDDDGPATSDTTAAPSEDERTPVADGCEVVTAADAEDLLGEPVERTEPAGDGLPSGTVQAECVWGATDERSFGLVQYRLWDGSQYFTPDAFADAEGFAEVAGLGDGAYFTTLTGVDLTVLVGDRTLTLNVSGAGEGFADDEGIDPRRLRRKLQALAERVVAEIS